MSRPNILVIQADQMTALGLSAYGKPYAITPNIDRLAENGTTFTNSYCNNPVCGPSRASMMTGRLPSDVGVYDNGAEFLPSEPTFAQYLRTLGYKTTLSGKMHFVGPDQLHGFEERVTTDIYPSDFAWTADWDQTDEPYAPSVMSLLSVVEAGHCERNLQIDYDEEVFAAAKKELYDHARSTDDRPFMLHVSFTQPHNPFVAGRKYWDMYEGVDIPEPEVAHIPYEDRDPWAQRYYLTIRQDEFDITPEHGSPDDKVFIEFNGEGLCAPALIMIKANMKLVHSRTDPKMLFDLANDPLELNNLAADPAYQDQLDAMFTEMMARWNEDDLDHRIRVSQRKRIFVQAAMKQGRFAWDRSPDLSFRWRRSAAHKEDCRVRDGYDHCHKRPVSEVRGRDRIYDRRRAAGRYAGVSGSFAQRIAAKPCDCRNPVVAGD